MNKLLVLSLISSFDFQYIFSLKRGQVQIKISVQLKT